MRKEDLKKKKKKKIGGRIILVVVHGRVDAIEEEVQNMVHATFCIKIFLLLWARCSIYIYLFAF